MKEGGKTRVIRQEEKKRKRKGISLDDDSTRGDD